MSLEAHNLSGMTLELWKMAQGGQLEKKLPWYGAAGGALLGGAAGGAVVPEKYKLLGQLAGTLAGTGVGLEGGQAIGKKLDQPKEKAAKVLTMRGRKQVKEKHFAIPKGEGPGDTGKYPIHDTAHAKSALTYVEQHGTPGEKAKVYSAVAKKYPGLSARSSVPEVKKKAKGKKKTAAFEDPKKPSAARVLGSSLLGMGAGMGAGYGGARAVDALSRAAGGTGISGSTAARAMPFVGGAIGMAAPLLHYATLQRMREEHMRKQQEKVGGRQGT